MFCLWTVWGFIIRGSVCGVIFICFSSFCLLVLFGRKEGRANDRPTDRLTNARANESGPVGRGGQGGYIRPELVGWGKVHCKGGESVGSGHAVCGVSKSRRFHHVVQPGRRGLSQVNALGGSRGLLPSDCGEREIDRKHRGGRDLVRGLGGDVRAG